MKTKEQLEEEVKKLQDELEALPKVTLKAGDLCEFWNDDSDEVFAGYYNRWDRGQHIDTLYTRWEHARKLETKATRIEWSGGTMPVGNDTWVVVEDSCGGRYTRLAGSVSLNWKTGNIVAYWVLEV